MLFLMGVILYQRNTILKAHGAKGGKERNLAWEFLGPNVWSRDFFGSWFFAPIRSSPSLEILSTPGVGML